MHENKGNDQQLKRKRLPIIQQIIFFSAFANV